MDVSADEFDFLICGDRGPGGAGRGREEEPIGAFSIDNDEAVDVPSPTDRSATISSTSFLDQSEIPDFLLDSDPLKLNSGGAPPPAADTSRLHESPEPTQRSLESSISIADDDFLAWLDTKHPAVQSGPGAQPDGSHNSASPSANLESLGTGFSASSFNQPKKSSEQVKYENEILKVVNSSFPDVDALRSMVSSRGFVPGALRGQVWSLLLHGTCSEDHEVEFWQSNGQELDNYAAIVRDCEAWLELAQARGYLSASTASSSAARDLVDVVVLYCVRRNIPYRPVYCDVLASMVLCLNPISRALASSCFYHLCSDMLRPAADMPPSVQEKYFPKQHAWLRFLVRYHFPQLCAHLDSIAPGWENRIESPSSSQIQMISMSMYSQDLLGSPSSSEAPAIRMERSTSGGCIPQNWMNGIFGVALPPEQSCWIWDWILDRGDPHAGIFLVCALFGLHSEAILKLDGPGFFEWITVVAIGASKDSSPWVQMLPLDTDILGDENARKPNFDNYTRAWIHASDVLIQSTPSGFLRSLRGLEKAVLSPSSIIDSSSSLRRGQSESMSLSGGAVSGASMGGGLLIDKLRKISSQLHSAGESKAKAPADEPASRDIVARSDNFASTMETPILSDHCVWSSADEVVPCLISSSKSKFSVQPLEEKMKVAFREAYGWDVASRSGCVDEKERAAPRGGEGFILPALDDSNKPFFFGIDCRSGNEILLGKFPKALSIDPTDLKDSYSVSTILKTLEPLIGHVHFCVIGVGELYCRPSNTPGTDAMVTTYNVIAEVIEFFLRRNLRHLSFLTGGFSGAVNYIMRDNVPFVLGSSLVDVDPETLDEVFGKGSAATYLGVKRAERTAPNVISGTSLLPGIFTPRNISASDAHVVDTSALKPSLVDSSSGLFSFVSSLASQSTAPTRSTSPSLEPHPPKSNFFSASASLFGIRIGGQSTIDVVVPESNLEEERKVHDDSSNAPKGAFVIDDDDLDSNTSKPIHKNPEVSNEIAVANDSSGVPKSLSKTKLFGGIKRSTSGTLNTSTADAPVSGASGGARLGGSGLVDVDPLKIGISKSDAEKAQALAMHKLAGLQKGDVILISRETLPGALLFPARKIKAIPPPNTGSLMEPSTDQSNSASTVELSRFIVLTKERIIVLDSNGGGVGTEALVKSNHHLTELVKLTFRKRDPELLTLFVTHDVIGAEDAEDLDVKSRGTAPTAMKVKQYRLVKRNELVEMLQTYMKRFK